MDTKDEKFVDISPKTERVIAYCGIFIPIIVFVSSLIDRFINPDYVFWINGTPFYVISILWILIGLLQASSKNSPLKITIAYLIVYHLFAVVYILFCLNFSTAVTVSWVVLIVASYVYTKRTGAFLSFLTLTCVAGASLITDSIRNLPFIELLEMNLIHYGITAAVSIFVVIIIKAEEADRKELNKKRVEEQLQKNRILGLVNAMVSSVVYTDEKGIIELYNSATLDLLNTNSIITGEHIDDILHLTDSHHKRYRLEKSMKSIRSTKHHDDLYITISGEDLILDIACIPIKNTDSLYNKKSGYLFLIRDVTKQKTLDEEKDEFISVVSHELRTPIAVAEASLSNSLLIADRKDSPKDMILKNIKTSHEQILFLAKMVNDLSTLSRAERGVADEPEIINVNELLHDIYKEYEIQARNRQLHLDLNIPSKIGNVYVSRLYLKELIQNFVTNSIKYTAEGGVEISAKVKNGKVRISVIDTGIGISKTDQQHLFEKFWRSEDYRTRETNGTGLGLYVSHKLSKKLGTNIEVQSRLNHGSTFSFEIPLYTKTAKN